MSAAVLHYNAAAVTDVGRKRTSNEDAFGYSVERGAYVVCDGMGGAAGGEIASSIAVDEALASLSARKAGTPLAQAAEEAVALANQAVFAQAQRDSSLNGMGTTLVGLVVQDDRVCVLNVGDSRCYRVHQGQMQQITQDHSLVEEQVRMGRMTAAQAHGSPMRHVITRALGTQAEVAPDCFEMQAEPGDLFLLCSDGLTGELSDVTIHALLAGNRPLPERCTRLVEAAKKAGGSDNITCLLVQAVG